MVGVPEHTQVLPGDFGDVAVVVIPNGAGGTHAGVIYLRGDSTHRFLHLAFHHTLCIQGVPTSGLFGSPRVPGRLLSHLLMLLDTLEPANRGSINYAFRYDGTTKFDVATGVIRLGNGCIGLTCATFVLAAFDSVGFPLVDPSSWTARTGDPEAMDALVKLLRKYEAEGKATQGYANSVAAEAATCSRFRPEDVLAAATEPATPPHTMTTIQERSAAIGIWVVPPSPPAVAQLAEIVEEVSSTAEESSKPSTEDGSGRLEP